MSDAVEMTGAFSPGIKTSFSPREVFEFSKLRLDDDDDLFLERTVLVDDDDEVDRCIPFDAIDAAVIVAPAAACCACCRGTTRFLWRRPSL